MRQALTPGATRLRLAWRMQRSELGLLIGSGLVLTPVALALPSLGEAGVIPC